MTVSELIEKLRELPQNSMVVVNGYEGGVRTVKDAKPTVIAVDVNTEWYYGEHEIYHSDRDYPDLTAFEKAHAVWIG